MSTGDIQYQTYSWDPLGNLTRRHWEIGSLNPTSHTEDFYYDNMNRLTRTVLDNVVTQTIAYNALGNISSKTGQGAYTYGQGMQYGNAGIHAVTSVGSDTYTYDANGNMTSGNGRQIIWNAANYPVQITQGATSKTFEYGPAKQRYLQHRYTNGALTQTMITIGGLFQRTENYTSGKITYQHYIKAAGKTIAIHTRENNYTQTTEYLHRDHLGSIVAITDEDGDIVTRMRYDAFGARQQTDGQGTATNPLPAMDRGYTGHQMLDAVGLIHMNGRVYDPAIGRFLSADPFIQFPYSSQSYNRYSYVRNNPLSVTDPSGFVEEQDEPCGPDLDCDGDVEGNEDERALDECYRQSGERCEIMDNRDGTFTTVPKSEVQDYIYDTVEARIGEAIENGDLEPGEVMVFEIIGLEETHAYAIVGAICSTEQTGCNEDKKRESFAYANNNDVPFSFNDLGSGQRILVVPGFLPGLGLVPIPQPIRHQEFSSLSMSINTTLDWHFFDPGSVSHRVYFQQEMLLYTVLGMGQGNLPRFNNRLGEFLFRPGVEDVVDRFGGTP